MSTNSPICPYCGGEAGLVTGRDVYPARPDLHDRYIWYCANGHPAAWVGCHDETLEPKGRLADKRLRRAKRDAHEALDWLVEDGLIKSPAVWVAEQLGVGVDEAHLGALNVEQCNRISDLAMRMIRSHRHGCG